MMEVDVNLPRVDIDATIKEVHKTMTKFTIDTLAKWVTGSTDPVPVWSGASRASFLKLAGQAQVSISINPVAPSRIPLGIETSEGEVFANPGEQYGWLWSSDLAHIGIVDDRVDFVGAGNRIVDASNPELPGVVLERSNA